MQVILSKYVNVGPLGDPCAITFWEDKLLKCLVGELKC